MNIEKGSGMTRDTNISKRSNERPSEGEGTLEDLGDDDDDKNAATIALLCTEQNKIKGNLSTQLRVLRQHLGNLLIQ